MRKLKINEEVLKNIERNRQQERQQRVREEQEKKTQYAINHERQRIIGRIVSEYFPEVMRFKPHRTDAENKLEFAPLINFLSVLASQKRVMTQLKEIAGKRTSADNQ